MLILLYGGGEPKMMVILKTIFKCIFMNATNYILAKIYLKVVPMGAYSSVTIDHILWRHIAPRATVS